MFNRYVDGLAATAPDDDAFYKKIGQHLADHGYDQLQSDGKRFGEQRMTISQSPITDNGHTTNTYLG